MVEIPIEHRVAPQNAPIEERSVWFDSRPSDKDLSACVGLGLPGHSMTEIEEDEQTLSIFPRNMPIKAMTIFMYCVLGFGLVIAFVFSPTPDLSREPLFLGMLVFAGLIIIPTMMIILSCINESMGDQPYLVFDKPTGTVTLPRVEKTFSIEQLNEVIFLDRWVKGYEYCHVALLAKENDGWTYTHLYNEVGNGKSGLRIFGYKELHEKLAIGLGIESRLLRFRRKECELL